MSSMIPRKPFASYKWTWATKTCTEGINDPVVLLGVLGRMRGLEGKGLKYSSQEFCDELAKLEKDIEGNVSVHLSSRGKNRNLIRNSGQYWKALGLIPADSRGVIELTEFGRSVADHEITQSEFAALVVRTFRLPNPFITGAEERAKWRDAHLELHPLMLILQILRELIKLNGGWITTNELAKVVVPLAGSGEKDALSYARHIADYRINPTHYSSWPDCASGANDMRMLREYLLFLSNYGYLIAEEGSRSRFDVRYCYNKSIDDEVVSILSDSFSIDTGKGMLDFLRDERIAAEIDAKRARESSSRPGQANFRKSVLKKCGRCVITNAVMPEIIQAAHIKPYKYGGPDTVDNGFAMRMDIHKLFDTNHLRISPEGQVELSTRARMDYGSSIPPVIAVPDFINREYLRWRWDNYVGL